MKKSLVIIVICLALIGGLVYVIKNNNKIQEDDSNVVKIGAVLPTTGNSAVIGEPKKRAFDIAMDQFNEGGKRLEVVYEDSHGVAKDGVAALNKLFMDKDIDCFYIDLTPVVNACVPQINTHKIITFAGSAQPEITDASDYLFRIFAGGDQEVEMMADLLISESVQNVFVLHTDELYGINAANLLKELFEEKGGVVIGDEEYPMNNVDFKEQLLKAKDLNPDRIVLMGYGNEYSVLLKQAQELGISSDRFVCNLGGSNKTVTELSAELIEGMHFIGPRFSYLLSNNALEPEMKNFVEKYQAKYNEIPDFRAAYAYDMVVIFMDVFANGEKTQEEMMSDFIKIKNFKGASGSITFKENGDTDTDLVTAYYNNGTMVLCVQ